VRLEAEMFRNEPTEANLRVCVDACKHAAGPSWPSVRKYSQHARHAVRPLRIVADELVAAKTPIEYMTKLRDAAATMGVEL
jgi:hypothetical protein